MAARYKRPMRMLIGLGGYMLGVIGVVIFIAVVASDLAAVLPGPGAQTVLRYP